MKNIKFKLPKITPLQWKNFRANLNLFMRWLFNVGTGIVGFKIWYELTKKNPEYSIQNAFAILIAMFFFAGRETTLMILKEFRGMIK